VKSTDFSPKVDAYIAKAAPFAQPVLERLRELIHKGCPDVVEEIKWSMPFFVYKGQILSNIAAFKAHCSFNLWGGEVSAAMRKDGVLSGEGLGKLGKIASVKELPSNKQMIGYVKQSAAFIDDGGKTMPKRTKAVKAEAEVPAELTAALKKNKAAGAMFAAFSPGCRREYVDWIAEAKRQETKEKRVAQAVEWMADGKQRNWKYQNC
jgi:uncharacterized protein YdeI (YjbR/CyaY-like superfamily)